MSDIFDACEDGKIERVRQIINHDPQSIHSKSEVGFFFSSFFLFLFFLLLLFFFFIHSSHVFFCFRVGFLEEGQDGLPFIMLVQKVELRSFDYYCLGMLIPTQKTPFVFPFFKKCERLIILFSLVFFSSFLLFFFFSFRMANSPWMSLDSL